MSLFLKCFHSLALKRTRTHAVTNTAQTEHCNRKWSGRGWGFRVRSPGCAGGSPDTEAVLLSWARSARTWSRPYASGWCSPWRYCSGWVRTGEAASWRVRSAAAGWRWSCVWWGIRPRPRPLPHRWGVSEYLSPRCGTQGDSWSCGWSCETRPSPDLHRETRCLWRRSQHESERRGKTVSSGFNGGAKWEILMDLTVDLCKTEENVKSSGRLNLLDGESNVITGPRWNHTCVWMRLRPRHQSTWPLLSSISAWSISSRSFISSNSSSGISSCCVPWPAVFRNFSQLVGTLDTSWEGGQTQILDRTYKTQQQRFLNSTLWWKCYWEGLKDSF